MPKDPNDDTIWNMPKYTNDDAIWNMPEDPNDYNIWNMPQEPNDDLWVKIEVNNQGISQTMEPDIFDPEFSSDQSDYSEQTSFDSQPIEKYAN
ncbi:17891_t:CDS:2 [Racocetra fulgida]|uniref:17891_t:CDS:1 n=1 Tax=Racocetra fulgida TaxID=60492 RepID=A0A9N8V9Z5_9GLOM|nr:17891_t:CDS:2 [Racocetra fulgida]